MLQQPHVPFVDCEGNSENYQEHNQSDRNEKRLNVYRTHQNECQLRVDKTSNEMNELHNHEIVELQKKSKDVKQKRVNKRGIRKQMEIDKTKNLPPQNSLNLSSLPTQNFQCMTIKQEFPSNSQLDDLNDIDLKGIENLVTQIDQPLTPEILNFGDNQFPSYQFMQHFPSSSGFQSYSGYFYNPNWPS